MKQLKTTDLRRHIFTLALMLFTSMSYSQDLAQAKALCGNVTAANKVMAKQAGYDLDALCSEVSTSVSSKAVVPVPAPVDRGTVSSSEDISVAVAPVAVSGAWPGADAM